jgi:uncharacterized protein (TIGR03437 family)
MSVTRILGGILVFCCTPFLHAQNPATSFTALPSPIFSGGSSTLSWSATCPTSTCTYSIDQGIGSVSSSGTRGVNPTSTTTYTFQVNNASVGIFEATVTVFVGTGSLSVTQSTAPADGGPGCANVLQYGVCELTFTYPGAGCSAYVPAVKGCSGGTVTNPWEDVTIAATFTGLTSGRVYNIGGFYMGGANSGNGNVWAVRFAPQTEETWSYIATFSSPKDYRVFIDAGLFTSTANPNAHGFLKLNSGPNPYILQTADKTPFYPFMFNMQGVGDLGNNSIKVGELFGAIGSGQTPATGYQTSVAGVGDYLAPFLTSGYNTIRNMNAAGTPSYVIGSLGVNNNVYLTGNAGVTQTTGSMTYDALYRTEAELGFHLWCTPVANAYDFLKNSGDSGNVFTSSTIQEYMHAWQYIINRYGAYCDVWELGNELSPVTAFMNTMASWVKQQDTYQHLTAVSYAASAPVANLDLQSNHNYTTYSVDPTLTLARAIAGDISVQHSRLGHAPVIFGEAGQGGAVSDPPANEDFRQWQNVSFFNQAFESFWPNNICNGYSGQNTECMGTEQLAQMALFSTFAGSTDPTATTLPVVLTGGVNGQTLEGWALGSSSDLAGYVLNTTNRTLVHNATIAFTVPAARMAGEWLAPSTGTVISTFTTSDSPGFQTFAVPDFSGTAQDGDIWFRIRATATPVVMTVASPGCLINTSCPLTLSAAGGSGGYTWAVTVGALPPGLALNTFTGAITGTVTQAGNWNFGVVVTDSSSSESPVQKLILVIFPAIAVGNTRMDNFTLGFPANGYHLPIVITGGMPPVTCNVTGATPPGLVFNGFCGASGTPTTAGSYTFAVTAVDSLGNKATASVSAAVNAGTVGIEEVTNPNATINWPYNWAGVVARQGTGGYSWAVTSGSLPAGLVLTANSSFAGGSATVVGTPTGTGSTFSLTATSNTSQVTAPVSYTITVNSAPFFTTSSLPSFTPGSMYYAPIGTAGGTPPVWCSVTGALPAGFILDAAACEIYGSTSAAGSFPIAVTVWDSNGSNVSSSYTLSATAMVIPSIQTIAFGALSDVSFGAAPFALAATASSGLAVSFASATPEVCTVGGTTVTIVGSGICWIVATQSGSASIGAAQPVAESFTVHPAGDGGPIIRAGGIAPVFSPSTTIEPGSWASIYGSNLAAATATWNGDFPTTLGGVTVTIDGKLAYLSYVGAAQINFQAPDDTTTGTVGVTVANGDRSWTSTVTLAQFGPSFSLLDAKHVAGVILRSDGSGAYGGGAYDIIGPTGTSLGYPTVAAKAGDNIEIYGVGFGPTSPAVPAGQAFSGAAETTSPVILFINNISVTPAFSGLSGAGLYQINLTLPAGLGTGDVPLLATVRGVGTPSGVAISLQ